MRKRPYRQQYKFTVEVSFCLRSYLLLALTGVRAPLSPSGCSTLEKDAWCFPLLGSSPLLRPSSKARHTRLKCAFAYCVHGVDHTPCAGSACSCCCSPRSYHACSGCGGNARSAHPNASTSPLAVAEALGPSDALALSTFQAPLGRVSPLCARTMSSRLAPRRALRVTAESAGATRHARSTRPPGVDRPTSPSVCGAACALWLPRDHAVLAPSARPRQAPSPPVAPHGSDRSRARGRRRSP
jgi:hypothetical protein